MKKFELALVFLILILALALRLYKINRPIADWHSWRQADTAAVARNFIKEGFNPLIPTFDDMSTQANGIDNPNRYRFVEAPIYNSIIAGVWALTGVDSTSARLTTVFMTLISTALIYLIVRRFSPTRVAALASLFFATIPYNVFYSSTILPGPFMVTCVLGMYYAFILYIEKERLWLLLTSSFLGSIALLSWPIAAFFFLPVLYLTLDKYKLKFFKKMELWFFAAIVLLPFLAWRIWILKFPSGIPNWQFLINEGNIRFKGAYFRWIFQERLGKLILTVGGFALFILGLVKLPGQEKLFYYSMLASTALYLVVFASGNVRHDYYQIAIVPTLVIFMAIGTNLILDAKSQLAHKYFGIALAVFLILLTYAMGFYEVQGYYWINRPQIVAAGQAVDRILPKDATVIAPYNGDTAFLYQTNRHGYPIVDRPLEKFVENGTKYLVSVDVGDSGILNLAAKCKTLQKTDQFVIVELSKECLAKP